MGRILKEGAMVVMAGGEGQGCPGNYVTGVFRAVTDIDLDALEADYMSVAEGRAQASPDDLQVIWGTPGGVPGDLVVDFQLWMVEEGHLERLPAALLWVDKGRKSITLPDDWLTLGPECIETTLSLPPEPRVPYPSP